MDPMRQGMKKAEKYLVEDGYEKAAEDFVASATALFALAKSSNEKSLEYSKKFLLGALVEISRSYEEPFGIDDFIEMFGGEE